MTNKAYYAVIPATVRYCKNIPDGAKLLYGEITALANERGYCWATNKYFSELYGASERTVSRWISDLAREGFVMTLVDKDSANSRKIWLSESQHPIDKNVHRVTTKMSIGSRQKCREGIDKNVHHNNTVNNTITTTSKVGAAAGETSTFKAEKKNTPPHIAPPPPPTPPTFRPLDIAAEIERLEADDLVKENFQRRVKLPVAMFGVYVKDFSLHIQTIQKTYSNVTEFRSHFFNYCDTHKKKAAEGPALPRANPHETMRRL